MESFTRTLAGKTRVPSSARQRAAHTGKNVGVGAVKGTGKIARGTGKALKHLF